MLYGYARCSTDESKQDIDRQVRELKIQGINKQNIYLEYRSGNIENRMQLNRLLNVLQPYDTIIATEVSRITRSTKQLCEIIEYAKNKHICLIFGNFKVDCRKELDPMTEGMLKMIGVFSELERNIISQRVKSGIINAKEKGVHIGRKKTEFKDIPSIFFRHYPMLKDGKINKKEFSRLCNLSYPTVYKYLTIVDQQEIK